MAQKPWYRDETAFHRMVEGRKMLRQGMTQEQVAGRFGVTQATISHDQTRYKETFLKALEASGIQFRDLSRPLGGAITWEEADLYTRVMELGEMFSAVIFNILQSDWTDERKRDALEKAAAELPVEMKKAVTQKGRKGQKSAQQLDPYVQDVVDAIERTSRIDEALLGRS
jgi:transcriptional regulator with XRE-family HTH domain